MSFLFFCIVYLLFRSFILDKISYKVMESLKIYGRYEEHKELKIKKYFDQSFILYLILYFISSIFESALLAKYFDIIPIVYLFCKLVYLYKD